LRSAVPVHIGLASASSRARARPGELDKNPARCGGREKRRRGRTAVRVRVVDRGGRVADRVAVV